MTNGTEMAARILAFLGFVLLKLALGLDFDGSKNSHARYANWNASSKGTLSFEFRTTQDRALLMYMDDGGKHDFIELILLDGKLRLRNKIEDDNPVKIDLDTGSKLNDNQWHSVEIVRNNKMTTLSVDGKTKTGTSDGKKNILVSESDVFFGGIPLEVDLNDLSLPSSMFEPRFTGSIRNIRFGNDEPKLISSQGTKEVRYMCADSSPCKNGGKCIDGNSKLSCDCTGTGYEGDTCSKEIKAIDVEAVMLADGAYYQPMPDAPLDYQDDSVDNYRYQAMSQKKKSQEAVTATFRGSEYFVYDLSGSPISSSHDEITLGFKTHQRSGLLFHTGTGQDYVNLSLKNGAVSLVVNLGSGAFETLVEPLEGTFNDNRWHDVKVTRNLQQSNIGSAMVTISVDEIFTETGFTQDAFTMLGTDDFIYVGGSPSSADLPGSTITNNFMGCLKQVVYRTIQPAETNLDLSYLAKSNSPKMKAYGNLEFTCNEVSPLDPVTFLTPESYLELPTWTAKQTGTISFDFRTKEDNGLLMYNFGTVEQPDFFACELLDGHLYVMFDLGSGPVKVKATQKPLNDGEWHHVDIQRDGLSGMVVVDSRLSKFSVPAGSSQLGLNSKLYVGGYGTSWSALQLPKEIWSGKLYYGFVGCMRDIYMDGRSLDIAAIAKQQGAVGVGSYCRPMVDQCSSRPCQQGGKCKEGWNRYICDCSKTVFSGKNCEKESTMLTFADGQYLTVSLLGPVQTEAEDITLRFRTASSYGLLLAVTYEGGSQENVLMMEIEAGRLKLTFNPGPGPDFLYGGEGLDDNNWHTVQLRRRGRQLNLRVDDLDVPAIYPFPLGSGFFGESFQMLQIPEPGTVSKSSAVLDFNSIAIGSLQKAKPDGTSPPSFEGQMQNFVFNGNPFIEMAMSGGVDMIQTNAQFGKGTKVIGNPITFRDQASYVKLQTLEAYSSMNLVFKFKTTQPDGLIMYNGGDGNDFLALELVKGYLQYAFNLGDGATMMKGKSDMLNDNEWHEVKITRDENLNHRLTIDDLAVQKTTKGSKNLDLKGEMYVGGYPEQKYKELPLMVEARAKQLGYQGCLASINLDGKYPDLLKDNKRLSGSIVAGCEDLTNSCAGDPCNGGKCSQQWNRYECDCGMTTYTGPTCENVSTTYEFGPAGGLITYEFPSEARPNTRIDMLAVGFTTRVTQAVLVRIDSATSDDFMEIMIDDGLLVATYNMGTQDHPVSEKSKKVNDGSYHIVRFSRIGANASLQLDNLALNEKKPTVPSYLSSEDRSKQLSVFNSQAYIRLGGRGSSNGRSRRAVDKPYFVGMLSGFYYNDIKVLDLARQKDPRVRVEGDVKAVKPPSMPTRVPPLPVPPQPRKPVPPSDEDDILVMSGSGCQSDDEDDCDPSLGSVGGKGEDGIITPIINGQPTVKPPKPPKSLPIDPTPSDVPDSCDDEDDPDCDDGSGSGDGSGTTTASTDAGVRFSVTTTTGGGKQTAPPTLQPSPPLQPGLTPNTVPRGNGQIPPTSNVIPPLFNKPPNGKPSNIITLDPGNGKNPVQNPVQEQQVADTASTTGMVVGIVVAAAIALLILLYAMYKYRNRDEGSYRIDESRNYNFHTSGLPAQQNGSVPKEKPHKPVKKKDSKEWYV
ncbi:neurexin-1-like isoform X2 [Branchiostoma floridae x Branchiostoma belcheri]